ncbi:hypothetical protein [Sphingobium phenoxybenzoativorans]|uniref:hypothetical protein n=1 Tax=Sphingobium phenoxybenzoativorans TaxID=1592790 RepID=UPI00087312BA|nr:hypothetical protein [Sphingobium phenoxybenzoativorans]
MIVPIVEIRPAPFVALTAAQDAGIARKLRSAAAAKHFAKISNETRNTSRRRFKEFIHKQRFSHD